MIYLDHQSAMPVDPRVLEFAERFLTEDFGNPSSLHSVGAAARDALEEARAKVADLINAEDPASVIFTSGATESNNIAVRGTALRNASQGGRVAASAIEHISVINPVKELTKNGFEAATIEVDSSGLVDIGRLKDSLRKKTVVTSIMHANSEIGTIQPIREIGEVVREAGSYFHVDATASAGRVPVDVQDMGIDLLTLSSNDMYGPRGAGALYVRRGVKVQPVLPGGGQERGLRSGTENVFAAAGFGEAAGIAGEEMEEESARLSSIRDKLISGILRIDESRLLGHPEKRLPHHAGFRFRGIEGEGILLLMDKRGIQVNTGSACSSKTLEPSHVLLAVGLKHEEAHGTMVMTMGRSNRLEQADEIIAAARETVEKLRELSPLWKK